MIKDSSNQSFVLSTNEIKQALKDEIIPDKTGSIKIYANKENLDDKIFKIIRLGQNNIEYPLIIEPDINSKIENKYKFN